jgi:hypothetical protein
MKLAWYGLVGLSVAACGRSPGLSLSATVTDRYPDLVATPPSSLYLTPNAGQIELRFGTTIGNQGPGPMQIRAHNQGGVSHAYQEILAPDGQVLMTKDVGVFEYHPTHHHFHVDNVATYELRAGSLQGPLAGTGKKISACIQDDVPFGSGNAWRGYQTCTPTLQGISVGWADVYGAQVPDQFLNVTNLAPGDYYLITRFDPTQKFLDANRSNDVAWVHLSMNPQAYQVQRLDESGRYSPSVTGDGQFWRPFWRGV